MFFLSLAMFVFFVWASWNIGNRISQRWDRGKPSSVSDAQLRQVLGKRTHREMQRIGKKIVKFYEEVK